MKHVFAFVRNPAARIAAGLIVSAAGVALLIAGSGETSGPEGPRYELGLPGLAPAALCIGVILLFSPLAARAASREGRKGAAFSAWRAGSAAIHAWALSMAGISIVLTLFLGAASDAMGWTGAIDGDFPRVVINDFQENSYCALLLLGLYYVFSASSLRGRRADGSPATTRS